MRKVRSVGLGLALGLAAQAGYAQEIQPTSLTAPAARLGRISPAAKLGRVQPLAEPVAGQVITRGQMPDPQIPPSSTTAPQPMPGGSNPLSSPRPLPNPSVTEIRGNTTYPPPGVVYGQPIPLGQPIPVGEPFLVGQPYMIGHPVPSISGPIAQTPPVASPPGVPVAAPFPGTATPVSMPSVLPGDCPTGHCPPPFLDTPLFGGHSIAGGPGMVGGRPRFSVTAEGLLWWLPNFNLPALLTTSSPAFNGIIGQGDTRVLLSGSSLEDSFHGGARFGGRYWFGPEMKWGFGGDFFFLGKNTGTFLAESSTIPLIARPFLNLNQNQQFSEIVAFPGFSVGSTLVTTATDAWGGGFDIYRNIVSTPCHHLNFLTGFRFMRLNEELTITETFARLPNAPRTLGLPNVLSGVVTDKFSTVNEFYGANFGIDGEIRRGRFTLGGRAAIAVGEVFQTVQIDGMQALRYDTGAAAMFPGGLLALPGASLGNFKRDQFAVMPEIGVKLGYDLLPHLRLTVGYNLIYLSSVLRPGDQVDTALDVTRIPNFPLNPAPTPLVYTRPLPPLRDTGLTLQGITLGLQYNFY
jgi:hypothetical protein